MASARTDIHRPSSPDFDPESYECHGVYDLDPEFGNSRLRGDVVNALVARGYSFAGAPHGTGQCSHCGHWPLRYVALMSHEPTKTLMYVGETCLDNRFESLTKGEFAALRKAAKLNRHRTARRHMINEQLKVTPELAELLDDDSEIVYGWGEFLPSLADQFRRNGTLSERQVDAAVRSIRKGRERIARQAAERAAREAAAPSLPELPAGRTTIEGTVTRIVTRNSDFGVRLAMTVQLANGWRVDGTLPSNLDPGHGSLDELTGRMVRFDAALKASEKVPGYAFFSRPTKAAWTD